QLTSLSTAPIFDRATFRNICSLNSKGAFGLNDSFWFSFFTSTELSSEHPANRTDVSTTKKSFFIVCLLLVYDSHFTEFLNTFFDKFICINLSKCFNLLFQFFFNNLEHFFLMAMCAS